MLHFLPDTNSLYHSSSFFFFLLSFGLVDCPECTLPPAGEEYFGSRGVPGGLVEDTKVTSGSFIKLLPQVLMTTWVSTDLYLKSSDGGSNNLLINILETQELDRAAEIKGAK